MQRMTLLALAIAIGAVTGCQSSEQKQAETAAKQAATAIEQAAKSTEKGAAEAAKGLEQMAKGLEAMAGGGSGNTPAPVDPVSFRDLQTLFPDLAGWEKGKPRAADDCAVQVLAGRRVRYTKDDRAREKIG